MSAPAPISVTISAAVGSSDSQPIATIELPVEVSVDGKHLVLDMSPFARCAEQIAECVSEAGRFLIGERAGGSD